MNDWRDWWGEAVISMFVEEVVLEQFYEFSLKKIALLPESFSLYLISPSPADENKQLRRLCKVYFTGTIKTFSFINN
jgi:hypothetical protein